MYISLDNIVENINNLNKNFSVDDINHMKFIIFYENLLIGRLFLK